MGVLEEVQVVAAILGGGLLSNLRETHGARDGQVYGLLLCVQALQEDGGMEEWIRKGGKKK